ncbi:MAG TPA: META domain-containing protein [Burkholderiaceae bacterium]|nr:META domain-containing protein [Burkholderiaceae bacterium]
MSMRHDRSARLRLCQLAGLALFWLAACTTPGPTTTISGTATYRERIALPADAVFEATLEDVSRADAPAVVVASTRVNAPAVPIAFAIAVDPARIDRSRRYAVRGRITLNGQLMFTSDTAYPVFGTGDVRRVDNMLLRRAGGPLGDARRLRGLYRYIADDGSFFDCASGDQFPVLDEGASVALQRAYLAARGAPGAPMLATVDARIVTRALEDGGALRPVLQVERFVAIASQSQCEVASPGALSLENTTWKLTWLRGKAVVAADRAREPQLVLQPEQHRVAGSGGCNRIAGGYTLAGDRLTFGRVAGTLMACPDGMEQERAFLDALGEVARWRIDGQRLELANSRGDLLLRFDAVSPR